MDEICTNQDNNMTVIGVPGTQKITFLDHVKEKADVMSYQRGSDQFSEKLPRLEITPLTRTTILKAGLIMNWSKSPK